MLLNILKTHGLKKTKARVELLEMLSQHHCLDISEIESKIIGSVCDQATLFRTLKTFIDRGIIRKSKLKKRVLYELSCSGHHHHHFICNSCKKIIPFDGCRLDFFKKIAKEHGFEIQEHTMEFYGLCKQCKELD